MRAARPANARNLKLETTFQNIHVFHNFLAGAATGGASQGSRVRATFASCFVHIFSDGTCYSSVIRPDSSRRLFRNGTALIIFANVARTVFLSLWYSTRQCSVCAFSMICFAQTVGLVQMSSRSRWNMLNLHIKGLQNAHSTNL